MKARKFIIRKLISGKIKLTPELLRGLKDLGGEGAPAERPKPGAFVKPKPAPPGPSEPMQSCVSQRLVFVSLLPGRWARCPIAIIVCTFILLGHTMFATAAQAPFDAANAAFGQGRFADAARGFESILASDGYSAPVLYNLANAQYRDGKLGLAILNYERALALAPGDPEIAANLKQARTKAGLWTGEPGRVTRFTHSLSLGGWGSVATAALLTLCGAVLLQRRLPRVRAALGLIGSFAVVALLTAAGALALRWPEFDRAFVTSKECVARISPTTMGETVFNLAEGDAVAIRQTRGDFTLVQSREGRTGWVKRNEIGKVLAMAGK